MHAKDIRGKATETANGMRNLGRRVGDSPAGALLAALAVGFAVGLLLRILEKPPRVDRRNP